MKYEPPQKFSKGWFPYAFWNDFGNIMFFKFSINTVRLNFKTAPVLSIHWVFWTCFILHNRFNPKKYISDHEVFVYSAMLKQNTGNISLMCEEHQVSRIWPQIKKNISSNRDSKVEKNRRIVFLMTEKLITGSDKM